MLMHSCCCTFIFEMTGFDSKLKWFQNCIWKWFWKITSENKKAKGFFPLPPLSFGLVAQPPSLACLHPFPSSVGPSGRAGPTRAEGQRERAYLHSPSLGSLTRGARATVPPPTSLPSSSRSCRTKSRSLHPEFSVVWRGFHAHLLYKSHHPPSHFLFPSTQNTVSSRACSAATSPSRHRCHRCCNNLKFA